VHRKGRQEESLCAPLRLPFASFAFKSSLETGRTRKEKAMANRSRNKKNQPPTGEGKKQSPRSGQANELRKRSEVLQAQRNHPEENIGTVSEEEAARSSTPEQKTNPARKKAGR
jgi:hypothetical protein